MAYMKRIIDEVIEHYLQFSGAVYIRGPKWCGKTTTASNHAKFIYRLGVERERKAMELLYETDPELIFEKEKPILFDEWQECPFLWDEVKNQIDIEGGKAGGYLLTGSRELKEEEKKRIRHSGLGRMADLSMRTMSLYESGESNGSISLASLFEEGYSVSGKDSSLSLRQLVHATCRGGYPRAVMENDPSLALEEASLAYTYLINRDSPSEDGGRYDGAIIERLLKAYSRNVSTLVSETKILGDMTANGSFSLSRGSYDRYKKWLEDNYVIEEVEPWSPAFKSKSSMSATPKREFSDPSIAVNALGLSVEALLASPIDYGFLFENLCMRDLRVYGSKKGARLFYYHDRNGLETDAVLVNKDNSYALIECKLGFNSAVKAADSLLKVKRLIEEYNQKADDPTHLMRLPTSLIVIHGGKMALTLENGVHLVPIGSLKD